MINFEVIIKTKDMKVYISGRITGLKLEDAKHLFVNSERAVKQMGHTPVNPLELVEWTPFKAWEDYMVCDIALLFTCQAIYMQSNWGQSKGARIEYAIAKEMGLMIFFEGE